MANLYLDIRFNPENPDHTVWYDRLRMLLAKAPEGVTLRTSDHVTQHQVHMTDLVNYLRRTNYASSNLMGDARRMWRALGIATGMDREVVNARGDDLSLSSVVLKEVTMASFAPSPLKTETRLRLLAFITTMR